MSDYITKESKEQIDSWLKKYPPTQKRSAILPALHIVQHQNNGYLTEVLLNATAEYLGVPKIQVYEVVSFYSMFKLKPTGKHTISVCSNISCMLRGAENILEHVEKRLNIKAGETTKDGNYTLIREGECLAACCGAPMLQLDHQRYFEKLTVEKVDRLMDALDRGEEPDAT